MTVTWRVQPDAWAYQVVVRSGGVSHWRLHRPTGRATERTVIQGVPADRPFSVELTTPPHYRGGALSAPGFEPGFDE